MFEKCLFCRGAALLSLLAEQFPKKPYFAEERPRATPTPGRFWVHPVRDLHQGEAFFGRPPGLESGRAKVRIFPRRVLTLLVGGRNFRKMLILPKQGPSSRCKVLRRQREAGPRSPKVLQEAEKMHPKRVSAKLLEIFSRKCHLKNCGAILALRSAGFSLASRNSLIAEIGPHGGSSCCGAVEEGGRGRADGRQMGAALGEMRATYARKCSQSMPWLKMHGNLRRIGPRKTNGYFFARN